MNDVVLNLKKFDQYTKKMKADLAKHYAKVGVLAAKNARSEDDEEGYIDNATLASIHEFGSPSQNIPARSFFRLTEEKRSNDMRAFIESQEDNIFKKVLEGKTKYVLARLAAKWSEYIGECFETEGFGTWKPLSSSTLLARLAKTKDKKKFNPQILQDSGQLERSITYEVK